MLRLVVIVPHTGTRQKLAEVLELVPDIGPVAFATEFAEGFAAATSHSGSVALLSADSDDAQAEARIRHLSGRDCRVLVLVGALPVSRLEQLLRLGASGCAFAGDVPSEWIEGVRTVGAGARYVSPVLAPALLLHVLRQKRDWPRSGVDSLTDRELAILELIGSGLKPIGIAKRLGLSPKTVESHREKIKHRLGILDSAALNHFACTWLQRLVTASAETLEVFPGVFPSAAGPLRLGE